MESESTTLVIRHLPSALTKEEKEELLQHFGATKVRCMTDTGRMKHMAFANFSSHENAKAALSRLHQLEILGCHLIVEFANSQDQKNCPHESDLEKFDDTQKDSNVNKISEKEEMRLKMEEFTRRIHAIAPHLGLDYLPSPLLKYLYPAPTPSIITNIMHALASVPKFYTQVLHLMNKMNLPAPFGPVTPAPPLQPDIEEKAEEEDILEEEEMVTSTEESELESDEDAKKQQLTVMKRPSKKQRKKIKKPKLKDLLGISLASYSKTPSGQTVGHADIFDIPSESQLIKKIQFKLKTTLEPEKKKENLDIPQPGEVHIEEGGFGIIAPQKTDMKGETDEAVLSENSWEKEKFITLEELKRNRLSKDQIRHVPAFRNYAAGQPTYRLYIKNLAHQVREEDLRYIYGRYIDKTSRIEKDMFDIRLMKDGRMRGQAFITLATEKQAVQAMEETNAYILHAKPILVQFARSAKPKDEKNTKGK